MLTSSQKVFDVLEFLCANGPHKALEVSKALSLQKSSVHRFLNSLIEFGYVRKDDQTGLFSVTLKVVQLGAMVSSKIDMVETGRSYMLHTLTDGARLKQDLLAAKEKGYAEDISEISDSLHCVAVPILTPHGGLWAISLSGHCSVIREYGVENIVKHLKKAVWDMTSGYSAAPVA